MGGSFLFFSKGARQTADIPHLHTPSFSENESGRAILSLEMNSTQCVIDANPDVTGTGVCFYTE